MTAEEDAVAGDDLTGLELENITNDDVVDGHEGGPALTDDLDVALLLLCVELLELALLLVVVDGADEVDDDDGDENGDALDPVNLSGVADGFDAVDGACDLLGGVPKSV